MSINCVNFNEDVGNIGKHLNLYKWPPLQGGGGRGQGAGAAQEKIQEKKKKFGNFGYFGYRKSLATWPNIWDDVAKVAMTTPLYFVLF